MVFMELKKEILKKPEDINPELTIKLFLKNKK